MGALLPAVARHVGYSHRSCITQTLRRSFSSCTSDESASSVSSSVVMTTEPIHILGAGSIGMLLAASIRLAFPNYPVQLLLRDNVKYKKLLGSDIGKKKTLTVCLRHALPSNNGNGAAPSAAKPRLGPPRLVPVPAQIIRPLPPLPSSSSHLHPPQRPFRTLLVTTKAHQALAALQSVRHRITPETHVVLLCNGSLAVREKLQQQDINSDNNQDPHWHLAWTSHGAYRETAKETLSARLYVPLPKQQPVLQQELDDDDDDIDELFHIVHAGHGQLVLENHAELALLLDRAGLAATSGSSSQLLTQLWCKLAANCVINPLTALRACLNGALLQQADENDTVVSDTIQRVVAEVASVAAADGVDDVSETVLEEFVMQVIRDTANNKSSMWQDVMAGRLTEVEYLNGYIVQRGRALGIPTPVNEQLFQQVLQLTEQ